MVSAFKCCSLAQCQWFFGASCLTEPHYCCISMWAYFREKQSPLQQLCSKMGSGHIFMGGPVFRRLQHNYVLCSCRFTLPSFFLVLMLIDVLAIGENYNLKNSIFVHHACGALCVPSTYSVTDSDRKYSDMVLQFSGFHRQCTQSITLLYLVRYLTTSLILTSCAHMHRVK